MGVGPMSDWMDERMPWFTPREVGDLMAKQQHIERGTGLRPTAIQLPSERRAGMSGLEAYASTMLGLPVVWGDGFALIYAVRTEPRDPHAEVFEEFFEGLPE